jgi:hypothetical protein
MKPAGSVSICSPAISVSTPPRSAGMLAVELPPTVVVDHEGDDRITNGFEFPDAPACTDAQAEAMALPDAIPDRVFIGSCTGGRNRPDHPRARPRAHPRPAGRRAVPRPVPRPRRATPARLDAEPAGERAGADPRGMTIDLVGQTVLGRDGRGDGFEVDAFRKACLLEGVDEISLTLGCEADIARYEAGHRQ